MALENGQYISAYISEETTYGVPVAPTGANGLFIESLNFSDSPEYVQDPTKFSPYPDVFNEEEGHSNPSFEMVTGVPIAAASNAVARTAFCTWLEAAMGEALSSGSLPAYQSGQAFVGLSGDTAYKFDANQDPSRKSFVIWKKTRTGHEVGIGCVVTEVEFSFGLNQFARVTFRGLCKAWAKFEPGQLKTALSGSSARTSIVLKDTVGMIGVGAVVKLQLGAGGNTDTGAILITKAVKNTSDVTVTFASTTIGAASANNAIRDAMPAIVRTNRLVEHIFGDNIRMSLDGGASVINKISSCTLTLRTGVQLFNEDNTDLSPTEAFQGKREVMLRATTVVDPDDLSLPRDAFYGSDQHVQILAGGITGAKDGGRLLLQCPKMRLRRNAPQTPADRYSTFQVEGLARAQLTSGGTYTSPLTAYIR